MGIGSSIGQVRNTTYGRRDIRIDPADNFNWPELAGAKLAESSGQAEKPYIGAANVGLKSSSSVSDDMRSGAYIRTRTRGPESSTSSASNPMDGSSSNTGPNSSTVGVASSDEEDNGGQAEDNTLRRRRTLTEAQESKSLLLDSSMRELAGYSRGPLPSHSTRELAGSPGGPLPSANSVQELAERSSEEPFEELGRLAAELNHRLELQKQKAEDRGCSPTSALFGPPVVRSVSSSGPTSGFYEPQVVRPILEQEVHGSGPTEVHSIRNEWNSPPVVRPGLEQDQQNNAYDNTGDAYSNGIPATSDVVLQYPARGEGQVVLLPVLGQTPSNIQEERRQAEG